MSIAAAPDPELPFAAVALKWIAGNLLVPLAAAAVGVYVTIQVMQSDINALKESMNNLSQANALTSSRLVALEQISSENRVKINVLIQTDDSLRNADMVIRDSMAQNTALVLREMSAVREVIGELKGAMKRP